MGVIAADGRRIGFVDRATDGKVRLTCLVSGHGYHHTIPVAWVEQVDRYVHLNKGKPVRGVALAKRGWLTTSAEAIPRKADAHRRDLIPSDPGDHRGVAVRKTLRLRLVGGFDDPKSQAPAGSNTGPNRRPTPLSTRRSQ